MLIHSIVINQKNDWVFITQIEAYVKDKSLDDVAIVTKFDEHPKMLTISMKNYTNDKGGSWYELRFLYRNIEIIATSGLSHLAKDKSKLDALLGVTVPAIMAKDDMFILFSPIMAVETEPCIRMLRDYSKNGSLKPWCFKSAVYIEKNFHTPLPLKFYETEPAGYLSICSKLIYLAAHKAISFHEINNLRDMLNNIHYWKDLGFEEKADTEQILLKLQDIKKFKDSTSRKSSKAKRLLVELLLTYSDERLIKSKVFTKLYNGLLYPRVKVVNKQRVKIILKK